MENHTLIIRRSDSRLLELSNLVVFFLDYSRWNIKAFIRCSEKIVVSVEYTRAENKNSTRFQPIIHM